MEKNQSYPMEEKKLIESTEKITTVIFAEEHAVISRQISQIYDHVNEQLGSLVSGYQNQTLDADSVEKIIAWKQNLKRSLWQFAEYLKDHVERETAFLGTCDQDDLEADSFRKNEEVIEHLEELVWILDNTPTRKLPDFTGYIHQKMNELCQGVAEHSQWGTKLISLAELINS